MAEREHWLETMTAMHSLELIANRNLRSEGASMMYFDPVILKTDEISEAAKNFLREGYEADVAHSDEALDMVQKYATEPGLVERVQASFLRSIDAFDRYLTARLERAHEFESA
jgi:pyrroloquinoline-quinone synthase